MLWQPCLVSRAHEVANAISFDSEFEFSIEWKDFWHIVGTCYLDFLYSIGFFRWAFNSMGIRLQWKYSWLTWAEINTLLISLIVDKSMQFSCWGPKFEVDSDFLQEHPSLMGNYMSNYQTCIGKRGLCVGKVSRVWDQMKLEDFLFGFQISPSKNNLGMITFPPCHPLKPDWRLLILMSQWSRGQSTVWGFFFPPFYSKTRQRSISHCTFLCFPPAPQSLYTWQCIRKISPYITIKLKDKQTILFILPPGLE